jgi:MinD-like ATPase involved in chromosome partitioning or flagellar assembly
LPRNGKTVRRFRVFRTDANVEDMTYRGPDRGALREPMRLPGPRRLSPNQPVRPLRQPGPVPRPREEVRGYRPAPVSSMNTATVPARVGAPARSAHSVIPVGVLDSRHIGAPAEPDWRARVTRMDIDPEQAAERGLTDRVRAALGSAFPIAVLSLRGGVGKTTVVEALGSTFAEVRADRVIAVDVDAGDLADRHGRRAALTMRDLVAGRAVIRYRDLRAYTHRNDSGLEVLGLPEHGQTDWRIKRDDVGNAFSKLRNHYSLVLFDCGTALDSPVNQAVLAESRALVVVTNNTLPAVSDTNATLEWLAHNGFRKLANSTVLVINRTEPDNTHALVIKELRRQSAQFPAERVVVLPFDRHVHECREILLARMSEQSRRRYLEMAAAVAGMFPRRG